MNFSTAFTRRAFQSLGALAVSASPLFAQADGAAPTEKSAFSVFAESGPIGLVIVLLSVVALAVIIENFVSLKREKLAPPELIDEVQALFDEEQFQEAMELCENEPSFLARSIRDGMACGFTRAHNGMGSKQPSSSLCRRISLPNRSSR